jgi:2-keto-3-deoxy-L-rhamnonate aldolase RhmA
MSGIRVKQRLAEGGTVFGTFMHYTTNPAVVEVLPDQGLDFVVCNLEHNALEAAEFLGLQFALKAKGIACLARVHSRDPQDVAKICDSYADGVVVPYVEDVEEVKRLVAAAKYRPLKGELLERVITAGEWPSEKARAYIEKRNANTLFCPMIESPAAVANLDAICSIPGLDAVFVGPNDLTVSMGIPDENDHPDFVAVMQRIIDTAAAHGIAAGCHFSDLAPALRTIGQGARWVAFSSDSRFLRQGLSQSLAQLHEAVTNRQG